MNPDPLDEAFGAVRRVTPPDRPADELILARLAAGSAAEPVSRSRRKLLMRVATWSLAASVLAVAGGLLLFNGSSTVALADVVKAAEKYKLVKYKMTTTTEVTPPAGVPVQPGKSMAGTVHYADLRAPRFRTEVPEAVRGNVIRSSGYSVVDRAKNRFLSVFSNEPTVKPDDPDLDEATKQLLKQLESSRKAAVLTTVPELFGGAFKTTLLDQLRELQAHKEAKVEKEGKLVKYTVPGQTTVTETVPDGATASRQVATTTVLWVDPATKLPVRMTTETVDPDSPKWLFPDDPKGTTRTVTDSTDFEWDPMLPDGVKSADDLFRLTPPEGYKLDDQTKKLPPR